MHRLQRLLHVRTPLRTCARTRTATTPQNMHTHTHTNAATGGLTPLPPPPFAATAAPVYKLAREAGMDPEKFCRIRNACFLSDRDASLESAAQMSTAASTAASPGGGGSGPSELARLNTWTEFPLQIRAKALWFDVLDYVEDPMSAASWMYDQQQKMRWDASVMQVDVQPSQAVRSD